MEIHKNTNQKTNELLNEARHEKPVMNLKEVENIISTGSYTSAATNSGFHIGLNNLIVICGITISSFLAYMALKVDKGDLMISPATSTIKQTASVVSKPVANSVVLAAADNAKQSTVKQAERIRPKQNTSTLLASADKNLVATENTPVKESIVEPVANKMPSGEYVITFNYAGQDVRMKLVGDDVEEFAVDGKVIPADQYGDFDDIIADGKDYLMGNAHADEGSTSLNLIKYFDSQLRADQILGNEVQYKFELTSNSFSINGNVQSDDMFKKYRDLYQAKTGKTITEGSVYKFERGAKSE